MLHCICSASIFLLRLWSCSPCHLIILPGFILVFWAHWKVFEMGILFPLMLEVMHKETKPTLAAQNRNKVKLNLYIHNFSKQNLLVRQSRSVICTFYVITAIPKLWTLLAYYHPANIAIISYILLNMLIHIPILSHTTFPQFIARNRNVWQSFDEYPVL